MNRRFHTFFPNVLFGIVVLLAALMFSTANATERNFLPLRKSVAGSGTSGSGQFIPLQSARRMEASVRMISLNGGAGKSMKTWKLRELKDTPRLAKAKEVPDKVKLAMAQGLYSKEVKATDALKKKEIIAAALAPVIETDEVEDINTDMEDDYEHEDDHNHDALIVGITEATPKSGRLQKPAFMWPVEGDNLRVSSPFGYRTHPITGKRSFHSGIDIPAPQGAAVLASANGEVAEVGDHPHLGRYVKISHADGSHSVYGHLQRADTSAGSTVKAGERIGRVGSGGRSTGPHLHFSIKLDGKPFNPMLVLNDILEQKKLAFNR